jgi:ABC-type microcin C transport system permease subunit YejB
MEKSQNRIRIWLVALAATVLVPLVAGTLGCANRVGDLSTDNISWILICSSIPMMFFAVLNLVVVSLAVYWGWTEMQIFGVLLLTGIPSFVFSFKFVDSASGI